MYKTVITFAIALGFCASWAFGQEPKLKVGDPAPALSCGKWIKGEPVKEFEKGKLYVVEFWATWCGPCRVSIPHLSELQKQYKDIVFIGQDCWEQDEAAVAPFVEKMGDKMGYRVALDDKTAEAKGKMAESWMAAAGQNGIPTAFVVDKETKIAWIGHPMELDEVLKQIVDGKYDAKKVAAVREARQAIQKKLMDAMQNGGPEKALAVIDEAAKGDAEMGKNLAPLKFRLLIMSRQFKAAKVLAGELGETFKDEPEALNELAWPMVDPEVKFEEPDLGLAEKLARRANELCKGENAAVLDTLARVLFVRGQVDQAIELQTKAVEKAEAPEMKQQLQKALDEYKAKKNAGK